MSLIGEAPRDPRLAPVPPGGPEPEPAALTPRQRVWRRFRKNRFGMTGAGFILFMLLLAILAPVISPHNPLTQFPNGIGKLGVPVAPEWRWNGFFLGTDTLGRDVLSRIIWGARASMEVGILATVIAVGIGILLGLFAATSSHLVDNLVMRVTDIMMAFPFYLFVLLLVAIVGHASTMVVILVLGVLGWPSIVRMVRGEAVVIRELEYTQAALAAGASQWRIMVRHVLPNVMPTILVYGSLTVSGNIMAESGLSFLGLGVPPPIPTWGGMIARGLQNYQVAPWLLIFPGIALAIAALGFNLFADGLNEALRR